MSTWLLKSHDGIRLEVRAQGPAESVKKAFPDFKWVTGVRNWNRYSPTWVYSGPSGWVETSEVEDYTTVEWSYE